MSHIILEIICKFIKIKHLLSKSVPWLKNVIETMILRKGRYFYIYDLINFLNKATDPIGFNFFKNDLSCVNSIVFSVLLWYYELNGTFVVF